MKTRTNLIGFDIVNFNRWVAKYINHNLSFIKKGVDLDDAEVLAKASLDHYGSMVEVHVQEYQCLSDEQKILFLSEAKRVFQAKSRFQDWLFN